MVEVLEFLSGSQSYFSREGKSGLSCSVSGSEKGLWVLVPPPQGTSTHNSAGSLLNPQIKGQGYSPAPVGSAFKRQNHPCGDSSHEENPKCGSCDTDEDDVSDVHGFNLFLWRWR